MDYKIHTHATYAVCDAADAFDAAPVYTAATTADKEKQLRAVDKFFRQALRLPELGTGGGGGDARWSACAAPPLQVRGALPLQGSRVGSGWIA